MDLNKLKDDQKLDLCRWYFRAGFVCLPFLWAVNAIWFFWEAFRRNPYDEQKQIRRYVVMSAIGAALWVAGLTAWIIVFQTKRAEWGAFADSISFMIPQGIP